MSDSTPGMGAERPFPIMAAPMRQPEFTVPWWFAELAYHEYSRRYGTDQSLARLAERGGFGREELISLLAPAILSALRNPLIKCGECDFSRRHERDDTPEHDCPEKAII